MKDQLNLSLPRIEVLRRGKWQNGSSSNITYNREFVWIGSEAYHHASDWVDKPQNYKDLYEILQLL